MSAIQEQTPRRVGTIVAEDDLHVGQRVCIHTLKRFPDESNHLLGETIQVKAICLPFVVGQFLSQLGSPTMTLDCRFLNFMRVSDEFITAQQQGSQDAESVRDPLT